MKSPPANIHCNSTVIRCNIVWKSTVNSEAWSWWSEMQGASPYFHVWILTPKDSPQSTVQSTVHILLSILEIGGQTPKVDVMGPSISRSISRSHSGMAGDPFCYGGVQYGMHSEALLALLEAFYGSGQAFAMPTRIVFVFVFVVLFAVIFT